jgi:hypothetical protein
MTETTPSPDEIAAERPPLMSRLALGTYPLGGGYGAVAESVILEVVDVHGPAGEDFTGYGPIVVERFQVGDSLAEEFDAWMAEEGRRRAAEWPGAVRVRTFRAAPGVPQQWPYPRYQGKGNRMIWVDFGEGADARKVATDTHVLESLSDSTRGSCTRSAMSATVSSCARRPTSARSGGGILVSDTATRGWRV